MYLPTAEKSGALLLPFWHFLPKCWEQNQCSLWAVTQHTVTLCQVLNKPWLIQGLHPDNSIYFVWSFRYTDVYSLIPNFKFALKIQNERRTQPNAAAYPFYTTGYLLCYWVYESNLHDLDSIIWAFLLLFSVPYNLQQKNLF